MTLKTYRAPTMADALAEVKRDLGRDAVIVHTRTFKVGGVMGVGSKEVVEITASDAPLTGLAAKPRQPVRAAQARAAEAYGAAPAPRPRAAEPVREVAAVPAPAQAPMVAPAVAMTELAEIKRLVGQVLRTSRQAAGRAARDGSARPAPGAMPEPVFDLYVKLLDAEVATDLADELVERLRERLPAAELARPASARQGLVKLLGEAIRTADDAALAPAGRPLTVALVGPTGVGKTTTVAKLAARYKLKHGLRVGLITTDTYRIAAVDQLRTYAEIIGLPLKVVLTPAEMPSACAALGDVDVVLVDTAGRSPSDAGRIEELRQFLAGAGPHRTHLVLSAAGGERSLLEAARRYATLGPDRLILTKLDEAAGLGVIANLARSIELPLSFVTTGQEVPEHLEPARAERIAAWVIDGRMERSRPEPVGRAVTA